MKEGIKKYEFVDLTPLEKKINYSVAALGSLGLLLGVTGSVVLCNGLILVGGAIAYKCLRNKAFLFNCSVKEKLYYLVKWHGLATVNYSPGIYYDFNDNFLEIAFRLDGSRLRKQYLEMEVFLEDLFLMECVSKEQGDGYILYKLDRTSTERFNIETVQDLSYIKDLENDLIPINSKINWNFRKSPHALVAGYTGKGKTYFLAYLIKMFLMIGADIKVIDPKFSDLSYLKRILKDNVGSSGKEVMEILKNIVDKMNERYEQFKSLPNYGFGKDYKDYGYKPIVLLFDEFAAFLAAIDKKLAKDINDYLGEIILKGRQAGVFVVLSTQQPNADTIKTAIRDQLGLRVALGEMTKSSYTMIFGSEFADLGLNNHAPGIGYVYINGTNTVPIEFESPYFKQSYNFVKDVRDIILERGQKFSLQRK